MDKLKRYVGLAGIIMVGLPFVTFAQTPSQLFQQGVLQENGAGDLQAAVAIYEKIVADDTADRPVRAKALLHIGRCYQKLGKRDAQKAYQRIIEEFADQFEVVAEARERLAALHPDSEEHGFGPILAGDPYRNDSERLSLFAIERDLELLLHPSRTLRAC